MKDIPKRLRERARALFGAYPYAIWASQPVMDAIITAFHEIEQAARAEGERAGAERMREAAAKKVELGYDDGAGSARFSDDTEVARRIRALPTEPAKGA